MITPNERRADKIIKVLNDHTIQPMDIAFIAYYLIQNTQTAPSLRRILVGVANEIVRVNDYV